MSDKGRSEAESAFLLGDLLARQNLAAMRQLAAERARGQRFDMDEDAKDISVGRGRGTQKWRRWIGRDPS